MKYYDIQAFKIRKKEKDAIVSFMNLIGIIPKIKKL
jgi:hypothetical protein